MKKNVLFTACALLLAASGMVAADDAVPQTAAMAFNANIRVEIDAAGKPTKVEVLDELPPMVRAFVQQRVASWQYRPMEQGGIAASALTYVRVGACAVPDQATGDYRLGVDFKGNGPAMVGSNGNALAPPRYPLEMHREGIGGSFKVSYRIQPDGTTRLAEVVPVDGTDARGIEPFSKALGEWVAGMRYLPELVDGLPVATEMSFPVSFVASTGNRSEHGSAGNMATSRTFAARECALAKPAGRQPLAVDSPVQVIPGPVAPSLAQL